MKIVFIGLVTGCILAAIWMIEGSVMQIAADIHAIRQSLAPAPIEYSDVEQISVLQP